MRAPHPVNAILLAPAFRIPSIPTVFVRALAHQGRAFWVSRIPAPIVLALSFPPLFWRHSRPSILSAKIPATTSPAHAPSLSPAPMLINVMPARPGSASVNR